MEIKLSDYRPEINNKDATGHLMILAVTLIQLWLAVKSHETGDLWYATWIPVFVIVTLGVIARMDIMQKRLGGWLASQGDPWEQALATHRPTKYLMPLADCLTLSVVLIMLIYGEIQAAHYFSSEPRWLFSTRTWYQIGTLGGVAVGIFAWILGATKARTGFEKQA